MISVWENKIEEREIEQFATCIRNYQIMEGESVRKFEKIVSQCLNIPYAVATPSGTAALTLALMAVGVNPGDEVLVPDLTFIATANAAHVLGANVILAPTEKDRPIMDLGKIDKFVTEKTKAIITVDLNGRISWSKELCQKYSSKGIYIIDDACQAFMSGTEDERAGTMADLGCFSFGITKTVSTINGGMVVTRNKDLYEKMKIIKKQGMKSVFEGDAYLYPGFNFKLPDGLAAIGLEQLQKLDVKMTHMNKIHEMYQSGLKDVNGISFIGNKPNEFLWMDDILCDDRDYVRNILAENDIISRPMGIPLNNASYLTSQDDYRESTELQKHVLFLPCGPNQPLENIEKVIEIIRKNV